MQRTVKGTKVNLVKVEVINGTVNTESFNKVYINLDEEKAIKKARKEFVNSAVVSTEEYSELYYLDDEIFFKYAVKVENAKSVETENAKEKEGE